MSACSAVPALDVPESTLKLSKSPPPLPAPPATGPFDSVTSRDLTLLVRVRERTVKLRAWCRVGVWTTLARVRAREFTTRESWGRLGTRPPRMLAEVKDQVVEGVVARLKPDRDGTLAFFVEVTEAKVGAKRTVGMYHGQRVTLSQPERHGYRFGGRVEAGFKGTFASWLDVDVSLHEASEELPKGVLFSAPGVLGFVAGAQPMAEWFREVWRPRKPIPFEADGIERRDFRLAHKRHATGFMTSPAGKRKTYGATFKFS